MIQLPQGFKVNGREAIDVRFILSKDEMLKMNDNTMPDLYFAICKDDGKMYVYQKTNELLEDTGKYRLYAAGSAESVDVDSIVSKEEGNILTKKEDGLFVEGTKAIGEEIIYSLFSSDDEEVNKE